MKLVLKRATPENGLFNRLKAEWDSQFAQLEDAPEEYYRPMMSHAEGISKEDPQDKVYGIFVLCDLDEKGDILGCEGMVHINHKFPKSNDPELRMVWNLLAPKYDGNEEQNVPISIVLAAFFVEGIRLCMADMKSKSMRMYLGNAMSREFALAFSGYMANSDPNFKFALKGGWLHIEW